MSKSLSSVRTAGTAAALDAMSDQFGMQVCQECGGPVVPPNRRKRFCCTNCRKRFNRRRERRGAQLYDLYMPYRYERAAAREAEIQSQMNRLCMFWRTEDDRQRGGRPSWGNWREFLATQPCLRAVRILTGRKK